MKEKISIIVLSIIIMIFGINLVTYAADKQDTKATQTIENGFYNIVADNNKVLDVLGGGNSANALVGIWQKNDKANQRFKLQYQSDGYFTIEAVHSGLKLQIDGSNIKQNKANSNNTQKWKIEEAGSGYYYIIAASNGLYLTREGDSSLKAYEKNDKQSQKFKLNHLADLTGEKIVEEGYYVIKSALNTNKVLDVNGASKANEANVQIWSKNQGSNQVFELVYDTKTQSYEIKSVLTGKLFDLPWAGKENETNVQVYDKQNGDWQRWIINKTSDGYYSFSSVCNGLYLDVAGNKTANGTNVEVYTGNGGKNQKFVLEKISIPENKVELAEGFYQISSSANTSKVIDILGGGNSQGLQAGMWQNNSSANQRFKIHKGDGYYTIEALQSSLYLEVNGVDIKQQAKNTNLATQRWIVQDAGNGYYYILSASNGLYLTFDGNSSLTMAAKSDKKNQKFKIDKKASLKGTQTLANGYYMIASALNTNKVIDVDNASISNEAKVLLFSKNSRNNQKFKITYDGNGYYTITSVRSKKVLDVAWGSKENESKVQQYSSSNSAWQKWIIEKNSDGTYSIISANSGLYIDIPNSNTSNGTRIQTYIGNHGKNQKFVFQEVDGVEGSKTISNGYYKIRSVMDKTKVFDIDNFSKASHTRLGIWSSNYGYNQRFKISYRENGFYTIKALHSGKVLDLASNGVNIEQDNLTYAEEQEWAITKAKSGNYNIVSAHNGMYLDLENGKATNGASVKATAKSDSTSQEFTFESVEGEEGSQTIANGTYQIVTYLDNNKVLDITGASTSSGANLEIWTNHKQNNQKFKVTYQGNGFYKITAVHSGKALGVEGVGSGTLVNVNQYDSSNNSTQDWIIKSCGNGYYNIISASNGLYLDVNGESSKDGTNVQVYKKKNNSAQKFKFVEPVEIKLETGTYGSSGLKIKGDSRGQSLKYYKIGNGPNVFFATFAVHGWEDLYAYDGKALTQIAEDFKNNLISRQDESLAEKWTIYIFPSVNPDGEYYGYSHNGPGRTTLYSAAPSHKGIDINRCFSTGYTRATSDRNYNGTAAFQAYEARALRDFLLSHRATNGQTILVDLHGWLNETIGDNGIGSYYRSQFGISKHIGTYGNGYLVNWARTNLGYNGRAARSCLVELPEYGADSTKYINATINMLKGII